MTTAQKQLVWLMAVMISSLIAIAILAFVKARDVSQRNACINNMKVIASTKETSALLYSPRGCKPITEQELSEYLKNESSKLVCPKGGRYTINSPGEDPECSKHGPLPAAMQKQ